MARRQRWPSRGGVQICIVGVGGPQMRAAGVDLIEDFASIAVMGFAEVLTHLPRHYALLRDLKRRMRSGNVRLLVCIDYPGFNIPLAEAAHAAGVPVLYYIAPQVWAWGAKRLPKLARIVTRAAVILPFEASLLESHGIRATFVGHPLLERAEAMPDRATARAALGLRAEPHVLALFPGSRVQEIHRHLKVMVETARVVQRQSPGTEVIVSVAPGIAIDPKECPFRLVSGASFAVLRAADAALCKSGTTTLEAAGGRMSVDCHVSDEPLDVCHCPSSRHDSAHRLGECRGGSRSGARVCAACGGARRHGQCTAPAARAEHAGARTGVARSRAGARSAGIAGRLGACGGDGGRDVEMTQQRWSREVLTAVGITTLQGLAATWRLRDASAPLYGPYHPSATPCIYVAWHAHMLPIFAWHKHESLVILASEHGDGELAARLASRWGYSSIRGSTTRGASRALRAMVRALETGHSLALTPDGPKGPREVFAPGALMAAQQAGASIVFMGVVPRHAWQLRNWDRFLIPKPWTEIAVAHSAPYRVQAASMREAAEEVSVAQAHMAAINALAQQALARHAVA